MGSTMVVATRAANVYNFTLAPRDPIPLVRGWNRLEGRPRSADFERSLRAEVRDPLWFLTRQWQFGEFEGEDAGSLIDARIAYESVLFDGYRAGDATLPYDNKTPLELRVEREPVPFDLMLHMQAARVFERLLRDRGHADRLHDYAGTFPLDFDTGVAGAATTESRALFDTGRSLLFDAAQLIAAVRDGSHATRIAGFPGLTGTESAQLIEAGNLLAAWYDRTYPQATEPGAWRPDRLDYHFACTAAGEAITVTADEHRGGELDWHAFDFTGTAPSTGADEARVLALSFLPTTVRFAGMPSSRYWEMEDSKTDFGGLDVNTNDLAKLLLAEFMLLFSDDWCVAPLQLALGSFARIQGLLVTDVFGEQTLIRAADRGRDSDWQRWSMYRLNGDDAGNMGLLLAPAVMSSIRSPPLEQVHFLRDEMANMVWAVERRIASKMGEALDPELGFVTPALTEPAGAAARFRLGETVPPNWRPFIPTHVPGSLRSIRLQRARLPNQTPLPMGTVLGLPSPYFVAEEEVPRSGRLVTRAFRRARWTDGATFLWIARESPVGRGEGSSGLVFDRIVESLPV
jgi:hypothetical protein